MAEYEKRLPSGYKVEIGALAEEQAKGFADLTKALIITIAAIFIALAVQFRSAFKPIILFLTMPFGMVGALLFLMIMGEPFGFMAFLSIVSLVGVIVCHIIVLFDYIDEMHEEGFPVKDAFINAIFMRLRPLVVSSAATILGLIPLASHGGPLWQGLCYIQIGGLLVETIAVLFIVPALYSIFIWDLKLVKWEVVAHGHAEPQPPAPAPEMPAPVT
jgi:multidrug efflux pump subunit AcrB